MLAIYKGTVVLPRNEVSIFCRLKNESRRRWCLFSSLTVFCNSLQCGNRIPLFHFSSKSATTFEMSSELLCKGDGCELPLYEGGGLFFLVKGYDLPKTSPRRKQSPAEWICEPTGLYLGVMNHLKEPPKKEYKQWLLKESHFRLQQARELTALFLLT